jgi:LacI family transcriptional regulator
MSTQKEVARLAGVSSGTVSNVITGGAEVSERVRKRVLDAIRELDYRPNLIARSLKTKRTYTLGIVVPDITIPFFPKVIRGAEAAARKRGYFLIVLDSEGNHEREKDMLALLWAQHVEGILLIAADGHRWSAPSFASITAGVPVVCLDRVPDGIDADSVCVDDQKAAEMGISHLLELGHRDIALITGPLSLRNEQERLKGSRRALAEAGVTLANSRIWECGFDQREVNRVCQTELLRPKGRPSAAFCTNGATGLAALRSIYSSGLSVPRDLAFVTFDEVMSEEFFQPAITSLVQPTAELGATAVDVLVKRIGASGTPRRRVRIPATLTIRTSSGLPRPALEPAKRR